MHVGTYNILPCFLELEKRWKILNVMIELRENKKKEIIELNSIDRRYFYKV